MPEEEQKTCGGNCSSCEACVFEKQMKTPSKNSIDAKPGQKVLIESQSSRIFRAAFLVYVLPLLCLLAGCLVGYLLKLSEIGCMIAAFAGLLLGVVLLVLSQKRRRAEDEITFEIISFL